MTKPMRRTKCQVESLEDRQLPTVTAVLLNGGATLSITGDEHSELVNIVQNDDTDELNVTWTTQSRTPSPMHISDMSFQSSTIKKIVVNLKGGDDSLNSQLDGTTLRWNKTWDVDLGEGNDTTFFDFGGLLIIPYATSNGIVIDGGWDQPIHWPQPQPSDLLANLVMNVKGGAGEDTIDAMFGNIGKGLTFRVAGQAGHDTLSTSVAGTVGASAVVLIDQDGGAGHDSDYISLGSHGILAGAKVTLNQQGGSGNDQLRVDANVPLYGSLFISQFGGMGNDTIKTHALMDWSSTGRLVTRVYGEAGNDQMTVRIKRDAIPPNIMLFAPLASMKIDVLAHGGIGKNVSWVTVNVRTFMTQVRERSWEMSQIDW